MFREFKDFAMKGNMIDMAVGIIIGAAFGTIINSLVADIIMPPIGLLLGNVAPLLYFVLPLLRTLWVTRSYLTMETL